VSSTRRAAEGAAIGVSRRRALLPALLVLLCCCAGARASASARLPPHPFLELAGAGTRLVRGSEGMGWPSRDRTSQREGKKTASREPPRARGVVGQFGRSDDAARRRPLLSPVCLRRLALAYVLCLPASPKPPCARVYISITIAHVPVWCFTRRSEPGRRCFT
jgi:hypothetical protein